MLLHQLAGGDGVLTVKHEKAIVTVADLRLVGDTLIKFITPASAQVKITFGSLQVRPPSAEVMAAKSADA